jgi:hypothetical protein
VARWDGVDGIGGFVVVIGLGRFVVGLTRVEELCQRRDTYSRSANCVSRFAIH